MTVDKLTKYLEDWAPPGIAWDRDNVGLQVGSRKQKIKNVMLSLDISLEVLKEAAQKNCNLVISHHPIIFTPIKKLDTDFDSKSQIIKFALDKNITIFSMHTNLDFVKNGVSFALAKKMNLQNIEFLESIQSSQFKISVFAPIDAADKISKAMFESGAGIIGEYSECSFRISGTGTFRGSANTNPTIGKKNNFEMVSEIKIECVVDSWNLSRVINSIKKNHPYEEPAYDVFPMQNKNINYGIGAIGHLKNEMNEKKFLAYVKSSLKCSSFRYAKGKEKIKTVAVCGGSGGDLLNKSIAVGADALITADLKYHQFQEAENKILLIDAGHFETEIFGVKVLKEKIENYLKDNKGTSVFEFRGSTNPVKFYKQ